MGNLFREAFADFEQMPDPVVWNQLSRKLLLRRWLNLGLARLVPVATLVVVAVWLLLPGSQKQMVEKTIVGKPPQATGVAALQPIAPATSESIVVADPAEKEINHSLSSGSPVAMLPPDGASAPEPLANAENEPHPVPSQLHAAIPNEVVSSSKSSDNKMKMEPKTISQPAQVPGVSAPQTDLLSKVTLPGETDKQLVDTEDPVKEVVYSICQGEELSLTAGEGWRYTWNTGDYAKNITVSPRETTTYEVTVEDRDGHATVTRYTVEILECAIYVPGAFSPNGDGSNDQFLVVGEGISRFEMKVFSKFGELVFETHDLQQGWDGRLRGASLPVDAYVYQIRFYDQTGLHHSVQGSVMIVP